MQKETKTFAEYRKSTQEVIETLEVTDEQDAVQKVLDGDVHDFFPVHGFVMYERTSMEYEGEILVGEPKNHSPYIYTNVDAVWSRDNIISSFKEGLNRQKGSGLASAFISIALEATQELIKEYSQEAPDAIFIRKYASEFVSIKDGEKVYNTQGEQLYPAPAPTQDVAPEAVPGL